MSDPVTNLEIEDVLSSIRRLISEDVAPKRKPVTKMTDRFVLTPALRVLDGTPPNQAEAAVNAASNDNPDTIPADDDPELEFVRARQEESPPQVTEAAWERITESDTKSTAELSSSRGELEARIAELEAAVARSREEWEPDGSEPDAGKLPERHIFAHGDPENQIAAEAIETVFGADSQTEVDTTTSDGTVTETPRTQATMREREDGPLPTVADVPEEQVLDEDTLRDLVTEIVKSELHGALGERITRNVRRMVRREIQQALALKNFE